LRSTPPAVGHDAVASRPQIVSQEPAKLLAAPNLAPAFHPLPLLLTAAAAAPAGIPSPLPLLQAQAEVVAVLQKDPHTSDLLRMGIFTGLAIAIHNLPEGLATFVGALNDTKVGWGLCPLLLLRMPCPLAPCPSAFPAPPRSLPLRVPCPSAVSCPLGAHPDTCGAALAGLAWGLV